MIEIIEPKIRKVIDEYEDFQLKEEEIKEIKEYLKIGEDEKVEIMTPAEFCELVDELMRYKPKKCLDYINYDKFFKEMSMEGSATLVEINGAKAIIMYR